MASRLKVKPSPEAFGKVKVGSAKPASLTLINTAKSGPPITFGSPMATIPASNPQEFKMLSTNCPAQLSPLKKCKLTLQFHPLSKGAKNSSVTIFDNASNANQTVPLHGKGN